MKRIIFIIAAYIMFISAFCWGTIINVPLDYPTIQTGIDASTGGDTVLVQPGTYVENINFNGHNIVLGSLFLTTGDTSHISTTIIDGDSAATVVTFDSGENNTARIAGLTIQNGQGGNELRDYRGGGITCDNNSNPTIINNNIIDNYSNYGAGISCINSTPHIFNNLIKENYASNRAGGIYCHISDAAISFNSLTDNYGQDGGGIYCYNSYSEINDNTIMGNSARFGGGIFCFHSDPEIHHNTIEGNSSDIEGGGILIRESDAVIRSNIINGNSTGQRGGGIVSWQSSYPIIKNNTFSANTSNHYGGGIALSESSPIIINNAIVENSASEYGGGILCELFSNPNIINSIIWLNYAPSSNEIFADTFSTPAITYCDIRGGWTGEGNIDVNPLYRDPIGDDFHLMAIACGDSIDSPCIDSGSPHIADSLLDCSWGLGTIASDMGAYGGGDTIVVNTNIIINVPGDYPTIQLAINACNNGDTVLVQPDTYYENINFNGRNIIVGSMFMMTGDDSYISLTIIDGNDSASTVTFNSGEGPDTRLIGFTIQNGWANHGGGIYCSESDPAISNNIISSNSVNSYGGGILFLNSSSIFSHNLVVNNTANLGGGICCMGSSPTIFNNVLAGNTGSMSGAGVYCNLESYPSIINTILWADSAPTGFEIDHDSLSSPSVTYCDIQGGWTGIGNIDMDPLFRDSSAGDFHIMSMACSDTLDSPCIDAGHPDLVDTLLDCSWGLGGSRSDMGAYGGGDFPMTAISDEYLPAPRKLMLNQNYPNPFNASTTIKFSITEPQNVRLAVYDLLGRQVKTLIDEYRLVGTHTISFDASSLSSGVYFYRLQVGETSETKRMLLLK